MSEGWMGIGVLFCMLRNGRAVSKWMKWRLRWVILDGSWIIALCVPKRAKLFRYGGSRTPLLMDFSFPLDPYCSSAEGPEVVTA